MHAEITITTSIIRTSSTTTTTHIIEGVWRHMSTCATLFSLLYCRSAFCKFDAFNFSFHFYSFQYVSAVHKYNLAVKCLSRDPRYRMRAERIAKESNLLIEKEAARKDKSLKQMSKVKSVLLERV